MSKPIIKIHNTETGEVIEREMTKTEFDLYNKTNAESEASKTAQAEKELQRQAILDRLGLTADEAKLLLG